MTGFEIRNLEVFWKVNLDQGVRIHNINMD
jgi:hypothetical protein